MRVAEGDRGARTRRSSCADERTSDQQYPHALNGVLQSRLTDRRASTRPRGGRGAVALGGGERRRTTEVAAHAALARCTSGRVDTSSAGPIVEGVGPLRPDDPPEALRSVGIDSGRHRARRSAAVGAWALGRMAESSRWPDRCIELASDAGRRLPPRASARRYLEHARGDAERSRRDASGWRVGGQELSARHGFLPMAALSTYTLGWARVELGDPDGLDIARDGAEPVGRAGRRHRGARLHGRAGRDVRESRRGRRGTRLRRVG